MFIFDLFMATVLTVNKVHNLVCFSERYVFIAREEVRLSSKVPQLGSKACFVALVCVCVCVSYLK